MWREIKEVGHFYDKLEMMWALVRYSIRSTADIPTAEIS